MIALISEKYTFFVMSLGYPLYKRGKVCYTVKKILTLSRALRERMRRYHNQARCTHWGDLSLYVPHPCRDAAFFIGWEEIKWKQELL